MDFCYAGPLCECVYVSSKEFQARLMCKNHLLYSNVVFIEAFYTFTQLLLNKQRLHSCQDNKDIYAFGHHKTHKISFLSSRRQNLIHTMHVLFSMHHTVFFVFICFVVIPILHILLIVILLVFRLDNTSPGWLPSSFVYKLFPFWLWQTRKKTFSKICLCVLLFKTTRDWRDDLFYPN